MAINWGRLARLAQREAPRLLQQLQGQTGGPKPSGRPTGAGKRSSRSDRAGTSRDRPDGTGASHRRAPAGGRTITYSPDLDGRADPGEVVWTWVAYEEEDGRGKDRPVLVVGREGNHVLALMLSSNARRDGQRDWIALGPGAWDREDRPSYVRLDRVLELAEDDIRREGAILARDRFDRVAAALRTQGGWR